MRTYCDIQASIRASAVGQVPRCRRCAPSAALRFDFAAHPAPPDPVDVIAGSGAPGPLTERDIAERDDCARIGDGLYRVHQEDVCQALRVSPARRLLDAIAEHTRLRARSRRVKA